MAGTDCAAAPDFFRFGDGKRGRQNYLPSISSVKDCGGGRHLAKLEMVVPLANHHRTIDLLSIPLRTAKIQNAVSIVPIQQNRTGGMIDAAHPPTPDPDPRDPVADSGDHSR
jgi:hypothetical protein